MKKKNLCYETWSEALIPVVFYCLTAILFLARTFKDGSFEIFTPHWDMGHYFSIASKGYYTYTCDEVLTCGNYMWFPGWPYFVRLISFLVPGFDLYRLFSIVAWVFMFMNYHLFYLLGKTLGLSRKALVAALAIFISLPAYFYTFSGYPYSFLIFFQCSYLLIFLNMDETNKSKLPALGLIAAFMSTIYPSAMLFSIVPCLMALESFSFYHIKKSIPRLLALGLPFAFGTLLLCFHHYLYFDNFFLFFEGQTTLHARHFQDPFSVMYAAARKKPLFHHEVFTFLWYGLAFLFYHKATVKHARELLIYCIFVYFFSLTSGSTEAIYRHYLLLFPMAFIIATSPKSLLGKFIFVGFSLHIALKWTLTWYMENLLY